MRTTLPSTRALLAAITALGGYLGSTQAQSVTTDPVGAVTIPAQASSETFLSVPLSRPSAFVGSISSVSGSVITVSSSPAWTTNQFVKSLPTQPNTYYVRVKSGLLAGQYFTVTANASNTLTIDSNGLDLSGVVAGNTFELTPYWTLGSLFPASNAGSSFIASANAFLRQTELYFANFNFNGINPPTEDTYFFSNGAWRRVGSDVALSFDDRVVPPDVFIKVSNKASATSIVVTGKVDIGAIGSIINNGTVQTDNLVAISFPVDVTLASSGLIESGAFATSPSAFIRTDELLVFSDAVAGSNRPALSTYYYTGGAWRKVGAAATQDFSSDAVFKTAKGVVIRKAASPTPSSFKWTYTASIQ